jgi:hypothetical protein
LNTVKTQLQTASELLKKSEKENNKMFCATVFPGIIGGAVLGAVIANKIK